jgi:hypothetical protein
MELTLDVDGDGANHPIAALKVDYYFGVEMGDEQLCGYIELSDLVAREDVVLCESVQRGMKSRVVPQAT